MHHSRSSWGVRSEAQSQNKVLPLGGQSRAAAQHGVQLALVPLSARAPGICSQHSLKSMLHPLWQRDVPKAASLQERTPPSLSTSVQVSRENPFFSGGPRGWEESGTANSYSRQQREAFRTTAKVKCT